MTDHEEMAELKTWLSNQGFRITGWALRDKLNDADWYAYRPIGLAARRCETNHDKQMQLVIWPYSLDLPNMHRSNGVEVEVCGEAANAWWKLRAYGMNVADVQTRLPEIERRLVDAWNALYAEADA